MRKRAYLSLNAHCRTQQHPVSSPSGDDLNPERKAVASRPQGIEIAGKRA